MTMLELVASDTRAATLEELATTLDDRGLVLFETVGVAGTDPALADLRVALERFLAARGGPAGAALLVAESLRLGAPHGVRAAACVDDRVVVAATAEAAGPVAEGAASPAPVARPLSRRSAWHPQDRHRAVPVTEFGRVPGPWLARLAEGEAFAITKRARAVVQVHPITDDQARAAGLYDHPHRRATDVTVSQLMDNPSGVLASFAGSDHEFALLRRHNVVVGCVLPAAHPFLELQGEGLRTPPSF
jgi:antitoxin (DNA-binding transcriptional repressor) of toxin-antitoxin stability system